MASVELCDRFGFFNGVLGIEQTNWAYYWEGLIPDGIIAGQGEEMEVYAQSDGMKVHVKPGSAMVNNHRAWLTSEKEITLAAAGSSARTDLIVLRVTYGNDGESKIEVLAKTGTTSVTRTAGSIWELALARVSVAANAVTIAPNKVSDRRYIFKPVMDSIGTIARDSSTGAGTVTAENDQEYRQSSALTSLAVYLPANPNDSFITGVCFTSGTTTWNGVTFYKGGSAYYAIRTIGDPLTLKSKRYNLVIWWDSGFDQYWCAVKTAALS